MLDIRTSFRFEWNATAVHQREIMVSLSLHFAPEIRAGIEKCSTVSVSANDSLLAAPALIY